MNQREKKNGYENKNGRMETTWLVSKKEEENPWIFQGSHTHMKCWNFTEMQNQATKQNKRCLE